MKAKILLFILFLCLAQKNWASDGKSSTEKNRKYKIQLLIGKYASASGATLQNTNAHINTPPGQYEYRNSYSPYVFVKPTFTFMYSYSVGIDYKLELSKHIGLRTGINYFTYGIRQMDQWESYGLDITTNYTNLFTASLLIPAHLMVFKDLPHGRFVFTVGPDLYLPIHSFGTNQTYDMQGREKTTPIHYHVSGKDFFKGGSMGFTLGLGYERKFRKGTTVEFMPDIRILNAVPFDFQGLGSHIYQNYIFNMAIGLSTYITLY